MTQPLGRDDAATGAAPNGRTHQAAHLKGSSAAWYASVMRWRIVLLHHIKDDGTCSCGNRDGDPEHDRKQGGKHPVHAAWQKQATTDLDTIAGWYRARPHANVGIATGRESGIFVLDVDPDNGGDAAINELEAKYGTLPGTWYVETGSGGGHYYFNYPDFEITNATKALRALGINGVDIRGDGGQVVAPPSVSGKGPYVSTKTPVVDAPEWLLDILRPKPRVQQQPDTHRPFTFTSDRVDRYTQQAVQAECELIEQAPDGDQNNTINTAAFNVGQLVGAGAIGEAEAREALLAAARAGNHPEGRSLRTIDSGLGAGMADPRHPWPPVSRAEEIQTPERIKRGVFADDDEARQHFIEPPDPLGGAEMPQPPAMAIDSMVPAVLANIAKSVDAHLQVPVEAPALMGLGVLSTASLGRYLVKDIRSGWTQPPIIRTLTLMRSGERKSDVVRIMARQIKATGRERFQAHQQALEAAEMEREKLEPQLDEVRRKLKASPTNQELVAQLEGLKVQMAGLPDPTRNPPQFTIVDSTPEALVQALLDNDECIGMLIAEDTLFAQISGMYSGTPNLGIYLSSYDEEEYIVNRVGKGVRALWNPALAISMLVQPHVVEQAAQIPGARSSGLLGRWIFSFPKSRLGDRLIESPALDADAEAAWNSTVKRLLEMPVRPETMPVVRVGDEARHLLSEFRAWIEPTQKEIVGRYAHMTDWTGKIAGTVLRLSGLYHLASGHDINEPIAADTMTLAVNLARWACLHAEYVHRVWRTAETPPGVEWILKWLRTRDTDTFTRRELTRSGCARQDWYTAQALDEALAELHRARWIASVSERDAAGRQKSTGKFIVHPVLKEGMRNAA